MKRYYVYVFVIIFLLILSGFSIYNYTHPIVNSDEKQIYKGIVIGINKEYEYDENSEYVPKYSMDVKINKDEIVTLNLKKDEISKYKENSSVNVFEDKGEYVLTSENPNTSKNKIWLIISILEICTIVILIIKMIKSK